MTEFRHNHYVPVWYQKRFLPQTGGERKFYYLDLRPDTVTSGGRTYKRTALLRWGPKKCFAEHDLYTTRLGSWTSTGIEEVFFGEVDRDGQRAVDFFTAFEHLSVDGKAHGDMIRFMSLQKLRSPKGMAFLRTLVGRGDKNLLLMALQQLQQMYGATWSECVWSIADASQSEVKFIVSDHPVTVYNPRCFPGSKYCRGGSDPDVRYNGTHTIFALSAAKILILTNISWVRNPYANPLTLRPNPGLFRDTVFNFMQIQTRRHLAEIEVWEINHVIKQRAHRYIAAAKEEWLYPERHLQTPQWDRLGGGYLFMPDPRCVPFTTGMVMGFEDGSRDAMDEYGRRPWEPGYRTEADQAEWHAHLAFQGEFARVYGPKRRGVALEFGKDTPKQDSDDMHAYYLGLEQRHKPKKRVLKRYAKLVARPEDV